MAKKILIVDDETNIVRVLTSRLEANNYEVCAAFDAVHGLRMAIKEQPDLILMDIKMPAGDGASVYEKIKKSEDTAIIPVIFITAYPSNDVLERVQELGAAGFVTKPFDSDDLVNRIREVLKEEPDS